jgi:hypothetical protein
VTDQDMRPSKKTYNLTILRALIFMSVGNKIHALDAMVAAVQFV